jgi:hypothetical protein
VSAPGCHARVRAEPEWFPRPDGLERAVVFAPGYNCPKPGGQGHGVHGMEIRWYLRGPKGGAWVAFSTDWIPGRLSPGHGLPPLGMVLRDRDQYPNGCGLGWCGLVPQREDHEPSVDAGCYLVPGGTCYSDMSFMASDPVAVDFTERGEPAIWEALESCYAGLKAPEATA